MTRSDPALRTLALLGLGLAVTLTAACQPGRATQPHDDVSAPRNLDGWYHWEFWAWDGNTPTGGPTVVLSWDLPGDWNGHAFRIYGRQAGASQMPRIATVTSCGAIGCRYVDANVSHDRTYEFDVATETRGGGAVRSATTVSVHTGPASRPARAAAPQLFPLQGGGIWIALDSGRVAGDFWKYAVYLVEDDGRRVKIGETDGWTFVDERADPGFQYTYQVAVIDVWGHYSNLSPAVTATASEMSDWVMSVVDGDALVDPTRIRERGTDQDGREVILHRRD